MWERACERTNLVVDVGLRRGERERETINYLGFAVRQLKKNTLPFTQTCPHLSLTELLGTMLSNPYLPKGL